MDNHLKKIGLELPLLILNCLGLRKTQRALPSSSSPAQNLEPVKNMLQLPVPQMPFLKVRSSDDFSLIGNLTWFHSLSVTGLLHVKRWEGAGAALCRTRPVRTHYGAGASLAKASGRTFCSRCKDLLTREACVKFLIFLQCD